MMDWIVRRLYQGGRLIRNADVLQALDVRGSVHVDETDDEVRHRRVRVARLTGNAAAQAVPPLHDVQLLANVGGLWSLTGYERVRSGTLADEHVYGQTWLMRPGPDEDLLQAHSELQRASQLLHDHGIDMAPRHRR